MRCLRNTDVSQKNVRALIVSTNGITSSTGTSGCGEECYRLSHTEDQLRVGAYLKVSVMIVYMD